MPNVLITGGAGFIGSHLVNYWLNNHPDDIVVCLDKLTYAGNLNNLNHIKKKNFSFIKGDICDAACVNECLSNYKIDTIIHLAASTHVDRSIEYPLEFIETNVVGTATLLNAIKDKNIRFHHVSTDEVFGSLNLEDEPFTENSRYSPNSPYSASKASSDHLVAAYYKTYNMPITISNCSNNYGSHQFPEKLIPLSIINLLQGKTIPIYGDGKNIRDWLYVEDHCKAIDLIIHNGKIGESYNIGGNNEVNNIDMVRFIYNEVKEYFAKNNDLKSIYPNYDSSKSFDDSISFVSDRKGHDKRYAIDNKKIKDIGFSPSIDFKLKQTVKWYIENHEWWNDILNGNYVKLNNLI